MYLWVICMKSFKWIKVSDVLVKLKRKIERKCKVNLDKIGIREGKIIFCRIFKNIVRGSW